MTCRDCIHYDLCMDKFKKQYSIYADKDITVDECEQFKNKADFVEVVRCKDCHYKEHWEKTKEGFYNCKVSGLVVVEDNDFCSYGERRDT